jgi:hypothetical protein
MHAALAYAAGALLLTLYGGEVCPFIDKLSLPEFGFILAGSFAVTLAVRYPIVRAIERRQDGCVARGQLAALWPTLAAELAMWLVAGLVMTGYNLLTFGFPVVWSIRTSMTGMPWSPTARGCRLIRQRSEVDSARIE